MGTRVNQWRQVSVKGGKTGLGGGGQLKGEIPLVGGVFCKVLFHESCLYFALWKPTRYCS